MDLINVNDELEIFLVLTVFFLATTYRLVFLIRKNMYIKRDIIKIYLDEYLNKYNSSKFLESDSKIKLDNEKKVPIIKIIISIILLAIITFISYNKLKTIIYNDIRIESIIFIIFIIVNILLMIILTLMKKSKIKLILKNSSIELYKNKSSVKTYELDKTNFKYKFVKKYNGSYSHRYINIYLNNDILTSRNYHIFDFEPYIAFIIFINLLKSNELYKIPNLNDDTIKKLQEEYIYNKNFSNEINI